MEFDDDLYAVLEIPVDADEQTIKSAYRQLARRYHPDTSTEADSTTLFLTLQKAYELLTDPIQRQAYDLWRLQQGLDRPLPLRLRVTPSQRVMPSLSETQAWYVLVEISASDQSVNQQMPLNLVLVVDCSTSMKGSRLQEVKQGVRHLIDDLQPNDILALIAFNDTAESIFPGQQNLDKRAAKTALANLRAQGGTELLMGMEAGFREAHRWHAQDRHTHLIFLTDGHTYGDEEGCLAIARLASQHQIGMTMMGIGSDWNDQLLDEIANISHGLSLYVDSPTKINQVLQDQIRGMSSIVAQDLVLSVHLSHRVTLHNAHQTSPEIRPLVFDRETAKLGALGKEKPCAVMLELLLDSHPPGDHRVLQLNIHATGLGSQPLRLQHQVELAFVPDLDSGRPSPIEIIEILGKLTLYKMQQQAMKEIAQGQIEPAAARLENLSTRLLDLGEVELARAARLEADNLIRTGSLSPEGSKKIRYGTRGLSNLSKEV